MYDNVQKMAPREAPLPDSGVLFSYRIIHRLFYKPLGIRSQSFSGGKYDPERDYRILPDGDPFEVLGSKKLRLPSYGRELR